MGSQKGHEVMQRCDTEPRLCKVSFSVIAGPWKDQEVNYWLGSHPSTADRPENSPMLNTKKPFRGELCQHEYDIVTGLPGKTYNYKWRMHVEELSPEGKVIREIHAGEIIRGG